MRFWTTAKLRSAEEAALASGLLLVAASALASAPAGAARAVADATGERVELVAQPRRIVTLAPSLGELAADLSGGELARIVGVSEYTDHPPGLARAVSVGPYSRFNLEKVVSLKPDLVLATRDGNPKDQVLRLRELGIPTVVVDTESLAQVGDSIRLVARAMGAEAQLEGERMATRFRAGLEAARARSARRPGPRPRVFLQVGDEPLVTVGKGTFLQEALDAIGAANLYSDSAADYPRPTAEDVVRRDPDVILVLVLGRDLKPFEAMAARWDRFKSMKAVKGARVHVLRADALLRPTLRFIEGLASLEDAVYPRTKPEGRPGGKPGDKPGDQP